MYVSLAVIVCFFALAPILKMGMFHNIAWIIVGLLFFLNPVWPRSVDWKNHAELKKGVRIGSVLVIVVFGFLIRYVV